MKNRKDEKVLNTLDILIKTSSKFYISLANNPIENAGDDKILCLSYYCRALDQADSIITLMKLRKGAPIFPILRSMIEAYADLRLLVENPSHYKKIILASIESEIEFHENVISDQKSPSKNRLFNQNNISRAEEKKCYLEQEKKKMEDEGIQILGKRKKVIEAFQLDTQNEKMCNSSVYWARVTYWELCGESHNGKDEVLKIHSSNPSSRKIPHLSMPLQKDDQFRFCLIISMIIYNSTASLTQFGFNFDTSKIMKAYQNFIEESQKLIKDLN